MVPSVKMADSLSLTGLVSAIRLETQSAMAGTLVGATAEEATITVSNLGAFGVEYFTPVLNLPQVAILGIGALSSKMEACELPLSLTFDHRAADGADAARFLAELVQGVEHIDTLLAN
jgi:pyruvate dehydrogenase E2 component (dihydrolipoamide acetyltransferase)